MSDVSGLLMRVDRIKAEGNAVYKKKQMANAGESNIYARAATASAIAVSKITHCGTAVKLHCIPTVQFYTQAIAAVRKGGADKYGEDPRLKETASTLFNNRAAAHLGMGEIVCKQQ